MFPQIGFYKRLHKPLFRYHILRKINLCFISLCHKIESTRKKESIIHINITSDKLRTPTGKPEDLIMMSRAGLSEIFIP